MTLAEIHTPSAILSVEYTHGDTLLMESTDHGYCVLHIPSHALERVADSLLAARRLDMRNDPRQLELAA